MRAALADIVDTEGGGISPHPGGGYVRGAARSKFRFRALAFGRLSFVLPIDQWGVAKW